jgi:uncharacterized protein YbjT (DUF2867 family)
MIVESLSDRQRKLKEAMMYAITGITGQVGGALARALLAARVPVRAVLRDAAKGAAWAERGCQVVIADMSDAAALTTAFVGTKGAFVLIPPVFDPAPGFPEVRQITAALKEALVAARPGKIVCLSTIGAQLTRPNLLNQLGIMEQVLGQLPVPIAFLRAAWFMENSAWDVAPARETGVVPSFLQPLDKPVPMVATEDIGRVAAELLREDWSGRRVVELEGPRRVTPNEIAAAFSKILGREVRMEIIPRDRWEALFISQGMKNPTPRIQMLDGFNEGWIMFEGDPGRLLEGTIEIDTVIRILVADFQSAGKG